MSTPLSFCDISARYGQTPAPQQTIAEQTGWNSNQLFRDYLNQMRRVREEQEAHAGEDALMAMIDAMNAPKKDREAGKTDKVAARSLLQAGPAALKSEKFEKIEKTFDGKVSLAVMPEVRALLACLGDAATFKQVDDIQEEQEKQQEQIRKEEQLEVTEAHNPSETSDPNLTAKEV